MRDDIASCWYVLWLQEGGQVRLVGSEAIEEFVAWYAGAYAPDDGRLRPKHVE